MLTLKPVNILTQIWNPLVFLRFTFFALSLWYSLHYGLVHTQALESKKAILPTIKLRINLVFVKPHGFSHFSYFFSKICLANGANLIAEISSSAPTPKVEDESMPFLEELGAWQA